MNELQAMTYALLLFVAYRVMNPSDDNDRKLMESHREYFDRLVGEREAAGAKVVDDD